LESRVKASREYWRTRVHAGIADIPNSCTLDHVPHCKALDRLVLRNAARAVGATHEVDLATALPVAAAISSFLSLHKEVSMTVIRELGSPSGANETRNAQLSARKRFSNGSVVE